ncbi:MAG: hypothetical protein KJO02_01345 [Erythrobacter sp.]|nr:hypothetical protein [Erythrobacter sp.]
MAMHTHAPKYTNWWVWGGAAVAAIIVIAALGYGFDWFGGSVADAVTPAAEQSTPASE